MDQPAHSDTRQVTDGPSLDDALFAVADPTRRAVIELLLDGPRRAGDLAEALSMTPPALSRHLRVLKKSRLVTDDEPEDDARVRMYRLESEGFQPLSDWVSEVTSFWTSQLRAFKAHAERSDARTQSRGSQRRGAKRRSRRRTT